MPQPRTMLTQEEISALLQIVARAPMPYLTSHALIGKLQTMMDETIGSADDEGKPEKEHVE